MTEQTFLFLRIKILVSRFDYCPLILYVGLINDLSTFVLMCGSCIVYVCVM